MRTHDRIRSRAMEEGRRAMWVRVIALALITVALLVVAKVTGLAAHLHPAEVQRRMASAGWWGPLVYVAVFAVGELLHLPGTLFIGAAVLAYGRVLGTPLAYVGAIASLSTVFIFVRAIGGKPLATVRWPWVERLLAHLDERPIRTVIALRTALWLTPQLNYALALTNITFRDYLVGSALGLVAPVIVVSLAVDYFLR